MHSHGRCNVVKYTAKYIEMVVICVRWKKIHSNDDIDGIFMWTEKKKILMVKYPLKRQAPLDALFIPILIGQKSSPNWKNCGIKNTHIYIWRMRYNQTRLWILTVLKAMTTTTRKKMIQKWRRKKYIYMNKSIRTWTVAAKTSMRWFGARFLIIFDGCVK